jgi:hypothetical protein
MHVNAKKTKNKIGFTLSENATAADSRYAQAIATDCTGIIVSSLLHDLLFAWTVSRRMLRGAQLPW